MTDVKSFAGLARARESFSKLGVFLRPPVEGCKANVERGRKLKVLRASAPNALDLVAHPRLIFGRTTDSRSALLDANGGQRRFIMHN